MVAQDTLLTLQEVLQQVGLSRMTVWRRIKANQFPAPVAVGERANRWKQSDISAWIAGLERR